MKRGDRWVRLVLPPVLLVIFIVGLWWIAAALADSTVFPTPPESMRSLAANLGHADFRQSVRDSLRVLVFAYLAAVLVGTVVGVLLGLSAFWSEALLPLFYALNSIPKVVLFPLFLLFLGIDAPGRGAFAFLHGMLPMLLVVVEGTAAVARVHLKLAAGLGLSRAAVIRKIVFPTIVPSLASGARLSFGLTFLGLLVGEMLAGSGGLGYELLRNVSMVRLQDIVGEVVLVAVLALVPTLILRWLESRVQSRYGA